MCIEDGIVCSVLDYYPNCPESIEVVEITEERLLELQQGIVYYDPTQKTFIDKPTQIDYRKFLVETDWKVLRHIRETALGLTTTLSKEDYLLLEMQRHEYSKQL